MEKNNVDSQIIDQLEEVIYPNIPFENSKYNFINGLMISIIQIIFTPVRFFRTMHLNKGYLRPLLFALICLSFSTTFNFIYIQLNLIDSPKEQLAKVIGKFEGITDENLLSWKNSLQEMLEKTPDFSFSISEIVLNTLSITGMFVFLGFLWHLILLLFRFPQNGVQGTIRVFCYLSAIFMINLIPVNFEFKASLIYLVGTIILFHALKEVHELNFAQALGALFLPPFFIIITSSFLV